MLTHLVKYICIQYDFSCNILHWLYSSENFVRVYPSQCILQTFGQIYVVKMSLVTLELFIIDAILTIQCQYYFTSYLYICVIKTQQQVEILLYLQQRTETSTPLTSINKYTLRAHSGFLNMAKVVHYISEFGRCVLFYLFLLFLKAFKLIVIYEIYL